MAALTSSSFDRYFFSSSSDSLLLFWAACEQLCFQAVCNNL
jgi:hypothetical protein